MISQGADERRIRSLLVQAGVGPQAGPTPAPAAPAAPPSNDPSDAWWDRLYASEQPAPPAPVRRPSTRLPDWWAAKPDRLPAPPADTEDDTADTAPVTPPTSSPPTNVTPPDTPPAHPTAQETTRRHAPPQSLLDAWASIRPRTRWLIHHTTAAAAGWPLGLVDWGTSTAAWYAHGHWTTPSAWVLYGLGACAISLYRRARTWAWPLAWAAAIPVSSVSAGLLLYGTGA
ncbi:hypothetical protein [Streptomyces coelicoflavus]|uniref:hypothetical protein n=1 Tax=Streptomyces coelicoflavus TaxID=285562 RepID=UPI000D59ACE1|nr:hypothetical protein [Streptomyces coelicoflavus]